MDLFAMISPCFLSCSTKESFVPHVLKAFAFADNYLFAIPTVSVADPPWDNVKVG